MKKVITWALIGSLIFPSVVAPVETVYATEGIEVSSESVETEISSSTSSKSETTDDALNGISIEQMQKDFNSLTKKSRSISSKEDETQDNVVALSEEESSDNFVYFSNLDYDTTLSKLDWGMKKDTSPSGSNIKLLIDGEEATLLKGIGVHTNAKLVYDISQYSNTYTKLSAYIGVDHSQSGQGDGVAFSIETSADGSEWQMLKNIGVVQASDESVYVNLDVTGVKYIRLTAGKGPNNNGSYDHAVFGDIRLLKPDYNINSELYNGVKTVAEYDKILSQNTVEENYANHKKEVLARELVNRIGYQNIQTSVKTVDGTKEALDWLLSDVNNLQLFIEAGGYFSGNGFNAINALGKLYKAHAADIGDTGDAYIYKKMLLATAAAHSKSIRTFLVNYGGDSIESDPVVRYEKFKKLYDTDRFIRKEEFKTYPMELVRYVVDSKIDNDEIEWLRDYIDKKYPNVNSGSRYSGYGYAGYVNTGYNKEIFYDESKKEEWDNKYGFLNYGVSYGTKSLYRLWMLMEAGGICWGLSGLGMVVNELQGIPSVNTYQPGHEAYLIYKENSEGQGIWSIYDDISGWSRSYSRWGSTTKTEARLLLEWGCMDYINFNGNNTTYMLLAQSALNNYDAYLKSMYYNLIANVYEKGSEKHEEALNRSLECLDINLDSLYGLIKSYKADTSTTDEEWMALAKKIIDAYTYFPVPMVDLLNLIKPYITDELSIIELDMLRTEALYKAKNATPADSLQDTACRQIANSLLGKNAVDLASFSFSGENAGKIIIDDSYEGYNLLIRVSLDGGKTWEKFTDEDTTNEYTKNHVITLTEEQIKKINSTDDILVGLMGSDQNYTIDIQNGVTLSNAIYKNDEENLLLGGNTENLEYSLDGGNTWQDYESGLTSTTRIEGTVTAQFRYKANGVYLVGPIKEYQFNENTDPDENSYLQLQHVTLFGYSTQQDNDTRAAVNFINGHTNNGWHTKFATTDPDKYYSVKFDKIRYIKKLTYLPGGANGRLASGQIYTSMDGETWDLVHEFSDLGNNTSLKSIELNESVQAKYLKLVATKTYGNSSGEQNMYFSGTMLNFYEDKTKSYNPVAEITYSTEAPTTGNVTAKLVLPEGCTSDELEYVFEENGTYTFKYKDLNDEEHSIEAKVTWIDRTAPTATVVYSTTSSTNKDVTASLKNISESVEFLDGSNGTYTFTKNGSYTFKLRDKAGNTSEYTATVTWINKNTITSISTTTLGKPSVLNYNSLKLTWKKVSNASGYKIYRATSKNGSYKLVKTISSGSQTSYTDTKLTTGKNYYYKIRVFHKSGNRTIYSKTYSNIQYAKPVVNKVTLSSVTNATGKKATIKWKKVSGASGYVIYRSTSKNGKYTAVKKITSGNTVSYTNSGLQKNKTYYYKIRAYRTVSKKSVYGDYSTVKYVKIRK